MSEDMIGRLGAMVRSAVQNACYMVHSMGEVDPAQRGMSTTASVVQVVGELIIVGQVGDSRVYLARDGEVTQLTEDHTRLRAGPKSRLGPHRGGPHRGGPHRGLLVASSQRHEAMRVAEVPRRQRARTRARHRPTLTHGSSSGRVDAGQRALASLRERMLIAAAG
jgi:serine/threonine protein phosphatase PrpC